MKSSKISFLMVAAALIVFASGCSKKVDETQKATEDATNAMQQMSQNMANATNKTPGVAIPAQKLAGFLPTVSGYTSKGEPEYMEMDMAGTKYSHASQDYENGDKHIKVSIMDYNYIAGLSMAYTSMMNMSMETNEESMHSEKFNGNPGWINWKKKSNEGTVGIVVNDRVFVIIEARNGATVDDAKSVASGINYSGIAAASK